MNYLYKLIKEDPMSVFFCEDRNRLVEDGSSLG